jgi:uncharacterized protein (UPF0332 family)
VTPEPSDHIVKARECLSKAHNLLDLMHYSYEAARAAYLAAFHAAQALVFERTARIAKSHSGLRAALPGWQRTTRASTGRSPASSHELTSPKKSPIMALARKRS